MKALVMVSHNPTRHSKHFAATAHQLSKHAEVMWAVELVMCKQSFRSCNNKSSLFSTMFQDRNIAKSFACVQIKSRYLICFGMAPYFKELLKTFYQTLTISFGSLMNHTMLL